MSGNTDCYQPLEATYRLTRGCLEAFLDAQNPVHVITKAPLIERDLDVLVRLSELGLVGVTTPCRSGTRRSRARSSRCRDPATPFRHHRRLTKAGISVKIHIAPVIVGLSTGTSQISRRPRGRGRPLPP